MPQADVPMLAHGSLSDSDNTDFAHNVCLFTNH
jgi:hypothetical protein